MKYLKIFFLVVLICTYVQSKENTYYVGYLNFGKIFPQSHYGKILSPGIDLEISLARFENGNDISDGFSISYSELPFRSNKSISPYRILFGTYFKSFGNYDPESKISLGGLLGIGLHCSFRLENEDGTIDNISENIASSLETGYWLGLELAAIFGYRFSDNLGISIKTQYDYLTKFSVSSKYLSVKCGLMIVVL